MRWGSIGPTLPPKPGDWAKLPVRQRLLVFAAGPASGSTAARIEQHLHAGTAAAFDARYPGRQVYDQFFAAHHIGALSQHDVALQSDRVAGHIVNCGIAPRGLLLL